MPYNERLRPNNLGSLGKVVPAAQKYIQSTVSNINTDFFPFVSTLVENLSSCANALAFTLKINIAISPITNTDLHRIKQVNM